MTIEDTVTTTVAAALVGTTAGTGALLPHHLGQLHASAISDEVIAARGYRTVRRDTPASTASRDLLKRLRIPRSSRAEPSRYPGILMPIYAPTGVIASWHYRPDHPSTDPSTGKQRKYAAPVGRPSTLDVHPFNRDRVADPVEPLWITEGIKKGDALTSAGECVITLSGVFNWRTRHGTLGDWEDVFLRGRQARVCFDADAATNANVAAAMGRLGRWLKSKGAAVQYIVTPGEVHGITVKGADDYLAAGGTVAGLLAVASSSPPEVQRLDHEYTDANLAEVVADEVLTDRFCWASGLGWMGWDGVRWQRCDEATVSDAVRVYFLGAYGEAAREGVDAHRLREMHRCLSAHRISAVFRLTRGIVAVDAAGFDVDPDLLNTPSGVVDLSTGELLPHDPDLRMTKCTVVDYVPGAAGADWTAALAALPTEVLGWYQRRMGQAITGHTPPDDVLLVCQGGGENGKTTVNGAIAHVLGDYAVLLADRVLLADPGAHPTELMELRAARLALIEETPEARRLNVNRLKRVVGTPKITARYIAKDSMTFTATHTLVLSTNYRPLVEESDNGTWRRLLLAVFPYRFRKRHQPIEDPATDRRGDPQLRHRLLSETSAQRAVLAWLVEGAVGWYQDAKVMPEPPLAVVEATDEWRGESDLVLAYVRERLVPDSERHVMASELLGDFNAWAASRGHPAWSDRTFAARFDSHTVFSGRVTKKKTRRGPALSRVETGGYAAAPAPASYKAWVGIRFATDADHALDLDAEGSPDGLGSGRVPGVPADSDDFQESPYRETPILAGTAGTDPAEGARWPRCACGELLLTEDSTASGSCYRCRTSQPSPRDAQQRQYDG